MENNRNRSLLANKIEIDFCYDRLIAQKLSVVYETIISSEQLIKQQANNQDENSTKENSSHFYARVSSDKQKEDKTIESQTALIGDYAQENDYSIPTDYVLEDNGYSGDMLARPGLERLRDLAAEKHIDAVIIYCPDRLSRRYAYQVLLIEEFHKNGVEVLFIKSVKGETPEERLLLQFQGIIAEYERAQIMERSRRGKRHKAKQGCVNVLSNAPYGYNYIKKTEGRQCRLSGQ